MSNKARALYQAPSLGSIFEHPVENQTMSNADKVVRVNSGPAYIDAPRSSDDEGAHLQQQQAFPLGAAAPQVEQQEIADDVSDHLTASMFKKTQKIILDIDVVASPAELAMNGTLATWRLPPQLLNALKYNTALTDRHTATGEQLAGNLSRCIPLGFKVIQQQNLFPYAMGIKAPGVMLDQNLHANGACLWRVPGQTATMLVGQDAFSPANIVNRYAYNNYRFCTVEDLASDVTFPAGRSAKGRAQVSVNSLAYQTLVQSLQDGHWADQINDINVDQIFEPGRNLTVEVTERIGNDIVKFLKPQVEAAANSFVDLQDLRFDVVRADAHKDFASAKSLIGEVVSTGVLKGDAMKATQLQTRVPFHIKAEFTFVLF